VNILLPTQAKIGVKHVDISVSYFILLYFISDVCTIAVKRPKPAFTYFILFYFLLLHLCGRRLNIGSYSSLGLAGPTSAVSSMSHWLRQEWQPDRVAFKKSRDV